MELPDNSRYEGGFYQNLYDGKGVLTKADGTVQSGIFKQGVLIEGAVAQKKPQSQHTENLEAQGKGTD
jgi:hypothetical protein